MSAIATERKSNSRHVILAELRRRIVAGQYAPGQQIPLRTDLEREFDASSVTIQRAMDHLRREEFIEVSDRKGGTYVAPHPPHLSHFALVFRGTPTGDPRHWSQFYQALANAAVEIERNGPQRVEIYYGVEPHAENKRYHDLVRAIRAHLFAGLIFGDHPYVAFPGTPLVDEPGIPRVAFTPYETAGSVAAVSIDTESFLTRALDALVSRNRRRLAVLAIPQEEAFFDNLRKAAAARGMTLHPYWIQTVAPSDPESARNCAHLLLNPGQTERPDALLITDDNLVPAGTAGILLSGCRVGVDLEVVAHANFPLITPSAVPATRLGFDARHLLSVSLERLLQLRRGETPTHSTIPAVFEEEIAMGPAFGRRDEGEIRVYEYV